MACLKAISPGLLKLCHQAIKKADLPRAQMNMFVEIVPSFVQHEESAREINSESGVYVEFYRRRIGGGWVLNGEVADVDDGELRSRLSARLLPEEDGNETSRPGPE